MFYPGPGSDSFQSHESFMANSPVNSGQSSHNMSPSHSSPFLPGYLLGDHHSHHHPLSSPKLWSSSGSISPGHRSTGPLMPGSAAASGSGFIRKDVVRGKIGGPPVKSLYSTGPTDPYISHVFTPTSARSLSSPALRQMSTPAPPTTGLFNSPGVSRGDVSLQSQSQVLPLSPAQTDPFYTQGDLKSDDVLDETWVTVYGFPPGATSFILQQFAQYGTILKHVVASECNWMHIHYMSKIQAKKALSKDGKIFGGSMKIGVTPCIEKNVMEEKENHQSGLASQQEGTSTDPFVTPYSPLRPLSAAYFAARGEYEVLTDKQTPKRDTGIVSKFKEYMFGY